MSRHRFFIDEIIPDSAEAASIAEADLHHAYRVLRLQVGEEIDLVDKSGKTFVIRLTCVSGEEVTGDIIERETAPENEGPELVLLQGLPRGSKVDEIIQKGVELGLTSFRPLLTRQSQIRLDEAASRKKQQRWQKIAEMAAKQSSANYIPEVYMAERLETSLARIAEEDRALGGKVLNLIAWEGETELLLSDCLAKEKPAEMRAIRILIGPEGGFAEDEVKLAIEHGYISVSLGKRILRTETAGPAILAIVGFALGRI